MEDNESDHISGDCSVVNEITGGRYSDIYDATIAFNILTKCDKVNGVDGKYAIVRD